MRDPVRPVSSARCFLLLFAVLTLQLTACRTLSPGTSAPPDPVSQAAVAIQLRAIQTAQNAYMAGHEHYACTMAELGSQFGLIDRELALGHKDGYRYDIQCVAAANPSYQVWATPIDKLSGAPAFYCIDQSGQMHRAGERLDHCADGRPAE